MSPMKNSFGLRAVNVGIVFCSAVNVGIAARFWRAVLTSPPPLTIDWTPAVYWCLGIVFAIIALQCTLNSRGGLPRNGKAVLLALNALCLAGYLGITAVLVYKSFAAIPALPGWRRRIRSYIIQVFPW